VGKRVLARGRGVRECNLTLVHRHLPSPSREPGTALNLVGMVAWPDPIWASNPGQALSPEKGQGLRGGWDRARDSAGGREEGREGGREEGRAGGREGGRAGGRVPSTRHMHSSKKHGMRANLDA